MNQVSRVCIGFALFCLAACSHTEQPSRSAPLGTTVGDSGFLGALYPNMQDGSGDQPLRVYRAPAFEDPETFAKYDRVIVNPVAIYAGKDSKIAKVPEAERKRVSDAVYAQIYDQLSKDYTMATEAGPNTLLLEVAIVDFEESWTGAEALSYLPIPVGVPGAKIAVIQLDKLSTGKPPFAGEVTVEAKISDAQTGEVVAAMVDRRVGSRRPLIGLFESDTYDSWADVDQSIEYFAERVRHTFCVRRGATACIAPTP